MIVYLFASPRTQNPNEKVISGTNRSHSLAELDLEEALVEVGPAVGAAHQVLVLAALVAALGAVEHAALAQIHRFHVCEWLNKHLQYRTTIAFSVMNVISFHPEQKLIFSRLLLQSVEAKDKVSLS